MKLLPILLIALLLATAASAKVYIIENGRFVSSTSYSTTCGAIIFNRMGNAGPEELNFSYAGAGEAFVIDYRGC